MKPQAPSVAKPILLTWSPSAESAVSSGRPSNIFRPMREGDARAAAAHRSATRAVIRGAITRAPSRGKVSSAARRIATTLKTWPSLRAPVRNTFRGRADSPTRSSPSPIPVSTVRSRACGRRAYRLIGPFPSGAATSCGTSNSSFLACSPAGDACAFDPEEGAGLSGR